MRRRINKSRGFPPSKLLATLCTIIIGILFWDPTIAWAGNSLRVHFTNAGYADAIVVQLPDRSVILIDTGDQSRAQNLKNYLLTLGISRIDSVLITHPHQNHFGGLLTILKTIPIDKVFINGDKNAEAGYAMLLEELKKKKVPISVLRRGDTFSKSHHQVLIRILNPDNLSDTPNNNSIVT